MMDGNTVRNMQSDIQQTRKIVHLVGFTVEIYYDARSHERQINNLACKIFMIL